MADEGVRLVDGAWGILTLALPYYYWETRENILQYLNRTGTHWDYIILILTQAIISATPTPTLLIPIYTFYCDSRPLRRASSSCRFQVESF
jgi:hypothetical protein